jgi:hypothetical protein
VGCGGGGGGGGGDEDGRHELVRSIVERVFVQDGQVVAMTLKSNYHLVLGHKVNGPTEVTVDSFLYQHGSDGPRAQKGIHKVKFVPFQILPEDLVQLRRGLHRTPNNRCG